MAPVISVEKKTDFMISEFYFNEIQNLIKTKVCAERHLNDLLQNIV